MRHVRKELEEKRKKVMNRLPGETRMARAITIKGRKVLKAKDVDTGEVLDTSKPLLIIGADVEALYLPLEDETAADIAY